MRGARSAETAGSLALALLLSLVPVSGTTAVGDWRPPAPDRLAALDAALAPVMADFVEAYAAGQRDAGALSAPVSFGPQSAMEDAITARLEVLHRFFATLDELQAMASGVLGVLDATVIVPCLADYAAVLRTGGLVLGDSVAALRVADYANEHMGMAAYLWDDYATLVHIVAEKDCATA